MIACSRRVGCLRARNKVQAETKAASVTRALGCLHVATEKQAATGHGIEAQEKAVRAFAGSQGYDLVEVFTDPGCQARPGLRTGCPSLALWSWQLPAPSTCS